MATRRFPAPWSVEWTEFNAWLIAHYDWAVYRQAQKYADRIGNVGAVTAPIAAPCRTSRHVKNVPNKGHQYGHYWQGGRLA